MSSEQIVDLEKYRSSGARVFAGRDRGREVRKKAGLDRLDASEDIVWVDVPEDTFSINSSFFLGLFGDSIRRLGATDFRRKYQFRGKSIVRLVESGIAEALNRESPL